MSYRGFKVLNAPSPDGARRQQGQVCISTRYRRKLVWHSVGQERG
jgi:hypothetical protein